MKDEWNLSKNIGEKAKSNIPTIWVKEFIKRQIDRIQAKLDTDKEAYVRYELLELLQEIEQDAGEDLI